MGHPPSGVAEGSEGALWETPLVRSRKPGGPDAIERAKSAKSPL